MNTPLRGKIGSLLNLHIAGVALLVALNLFLGVKLILAWRAVGADREDQIAQAQIAHTQLEAQTERLSGLPRKVAESGTQAARFYAVRIPPNYSTIAAAIGETYQHSGVRLTRASYTQTPAIDGLAEIRIDASVSGEYTGIVRFINAIERDKTFFIIDGVTLTGQQGGLVNLRLRLTTYLRAADASQMPASGELTAPSVSAAVVGPVAEPPLVGGR